jgi:TPP-dependent pyruvate/acetoin dehydrogenase alpha subunit
LTHAARVTCALLELYRQMALIREFETEAERQYTGARIGGYCHLSWGQEAVNVGAAAALAEDDPLGTGYRCHGFALARGVTAPTSCSRGAATCGRAVTGSSALHHLADERHYPHRRQLRRQRSSA